MKLYVTKTDMTEFLSRGVDTFRIWFLRPTYQKAYYDDDIFASDDPTENFNIGRWEEYKTSVVLLKHLAKSFSQTEYDSIVQRIWDEVVKTIAVPDLCDGDWFGNIYMQHNAAVTEFFAKHKSSDFKSLVEFYYECEKYTTHKCEYAGMYYDEWVGEIDLNISLT